jgi:hypothetical protein
VIIPRLGGFVLQLVPASYAEEDHMFRPMHKEVVFNAKLRHNDGLLAERYMQAFGVTFQRACKMLEEDVSAIVDDLDKGMTVQLGIVGSLLRGTEGQLIFKTDNAGSFSVDSYGLAPFHLKTWELLRKDSPTEATGNRKSLSQHAPVNRRVLRIVISSAAAIATFFLLSTPVKEISRAAYTANFLPLRGETPHGGDASDNVESLYVGDADRDISPEDFGATGLTEEVANPTDVDAAEDLRQTDATIADDAPISVAENNPATNTYYVIIASVNSRKKADEFIAGVVSTMPNASVIISGAQIRIFADSFADKSLADELLSKLRSNPKFADAWIYAQKK